MQSAGAHTAPTPTQNCTITEEGVPHASLCGLLCPAKTVEVVGGFQKKKGQSKK